MKTILILILWMLQFPKPSKHCVRLLMYLYSYTFVFFAVVRSFLILIQQEVAATAYLQGAVMIL